MSWSKSQRFKLTLAIGAVLLVGAGCGGGGGGGGGEANKSKPAASGQSVRSGTVVISMKNIRFQPDKVTVARGTKIVWMNDDSVAHDVHKTSGPGPNFASGPAGGMKPGDKYELRFTTPGTIKYVCKVHQPYMAGEITVK
ncbi:cupredoxin domain-containing protein [Thermoleophilum album]|uniref:Plastocyanin n=1 Tax=Thermoleophilum album TaxID=29539 RepID=A0A1H6FKY5_THEAL|nr:plastocyanin/azurin family copper-binding protein [Thermoleophilum album]SEH10870.1 Plastocyanin [Thermoleophilum album]